MSEDEFSEIGTPTDEELDRIMSLRRDVLRALAPDPLEVRGRIPLIGRLGGKAPTIQQLFTVDVVWSALDAMSRGEDAEAAIKAAMIGGPSNYFEQRAVSLKGKGRDDLVKVAAGHPPAKKRSVFSRLEGL